MTSKLKVDGYLNFSNVSKDDQRKKLLHAFVKVCKFYAPNDFKKKIISWESQYLHDSLITLRKKNPIIFSAIYDSMLNSYALSQFIVSSRFDTLAQKMLKVNLNELYKHGMMLRMDCPNDNRNTYGWHQDSAYDKLSSSGDNGCVFWAPLINTNKENGSIILMPKSQYEKNADADIGKRNSKLKTKKLSSKQILVDTKLIKKYEEKQMNVKVGETVSFYSGLLHKSGQNSSKKIRFTVLVRYNHINSKDFAFYKKSHHL